MVRYRLVELLPVYKPLGLLALMSPSFTLTKQDEGKAFYG